MSNTATDPDLDLGELLAVDPSTLVIGTNVRTDADLDDDFVDSIAEHGVLEAITVYRDADERLVVVRGQRRTRGAVKAGRPLVPVRVLPEAEAIERVIEQVVENHHRRGMSAVDDAAAVAQLAAFGLEAGQIVKRLRRPRREVDQALAVAGSRLAAEEAAEPRPRPLTLDELAALAEFEDDERVTGQLTDAIDRGESIAHRVQRARDDRAEEQAKEAFLDGYRQQGYVIVTPASYGMDDPAVPRRLSSLVDVDPAVHAEQCPGHAWCFAYEWRWFSKATGEELTEEQVDQLRTAYEEAVDGLPINGRAEHDHLRLTALADQRRVHALEPCCANPAEHGHRIRSYELGSGAPKGPMTDAEKAERRELVENNKAWKSAAKVRRDWLADLARGKAAPAGAEVFVYRELLRGGGYLTNALTRWGNGAGHQAFRDVMGLDREARQTVASLDDELEELLAGTDRLSGKRATLLLAVLVLCAWHHLAGPETWRRPSELDRRMLTQMRAWGYQLSAIERRVTDAAPAADDHDEPDDDVDDDAE